jgi:hypothetical protein
LKVTATTPVKPKATADEPSEQVPGVTQSAQHWVALQ